MEFDKSRVYTALNADELHEGDMVIVANNLRDLKEFVQGCSLPVPLDEIIGERWTGRFRVEGDSYALAYLVEREMNCTNCGMKSECKDADIENPELHNCLMWEKPKTEKHYRPFRDTDELIKVWLEKGGKWQKRELTMPLIWVRGKISKNTNTGWLVTGIGYDGVALGDTSLSWEELFEDWEFLDGSPCGVEE